MKLYPSGVAGAATSRTCGECDLSSATRSQAEKGIVFRTKTRKAYVLLGDLKQLQFHATLGCFLGSILFVFLARIALNSIGQRRRHRRSDRDVFAKNKIKIQLNYKNVALFTISAHHKMSNCILI